MIWLIIKVVKYSKERKVNYPWLPWKMMTNIPGGGGTGRREG
jgi:hypothetical protein